MILCRNVLVNQFSGVAGRDRVWGAGVYWGLSPEKGRRRYIVDCSAGLVKPQPTCQGALKWMKPLVFCMGPSGWSASISHQIHATMGKVWPQVSWLCADEASTARGCGLTTFPAAGSRSCLERGFGKCISISAKPTTRGKSAYNRWEWGQYIDITRAEG